MDDPPSLFVPGCIFLQTAPGISPELNTACGLNYPSTSAAGPLLALDLLSSEVGRCQFPSKPAASSSPFSAFVNTSKLSRTSAEFPYLNKGLTREPRVYAALIFGCDIETLDSDIMSQILISVNNPQHCSGSVI